MTKGGLLTHHHECLVGAAVFYTSSEFYVNLTKLILLFSPPEAMLPVQIPGGARKLQGSVYVQCDPGGE